MADTMTERDRLISRLRAASSRTEIQYRVLETISASLRHRQISPATAMQWLREEGLSDQFEEIH
jgi:hypothetical protein